MRKFRYGWLLIAVIFLTACGKEERREAATLCKTLSREQVDLAAVNALEKDLLGSTRAWCAGIISNGAGKTKELEENAASAKSLAQSANTVATQLSQVRQTLYDLPLKQEYPQGVRSTFINQIMKRQKMLQEIRMALDASAAGFLEFSRSRSYTGDSYPAAIDKLNSLVSGYSGPDDAIGNAIRDLKVKYTLSDVDLAAKT
jgi:uncharacterized protein YPO0396